jgi:hypothetical protein
MSQEKPKTIKEVVAEEYQPKNPELKKGEGSGLKAKDELFDKVKTIINKSTQKEEKVTVDWRTFNMGGTVVNLIKGEEVSKKVVELFGKHKDDYFVKK